MKILMINSVCGIRSTGRICTDLADALTEQGHEVKIAYGRENVPEKYRKYAVRIGSDTDVKLHCLRARLLDDTGYGSRRATERFIGWVKEFDPDVIHLHNIHGYYINIELLFRYLASAKKRVIWTLHDCWTFTGHCPHFEYEKCSKWKTGCFDCPKDKREYPARLFFDNSRSNWKRKKKLFTAVKDMTIVTPSQWLADLVKQSYLKKYPVRVIHNGIDTSVFRPAKSRFREEHGLEDKKLLLGVASTWHDRKGLGDFIKLSHMLDDSYKIILVGLSKKQLETLPENILGITRTNSTKELAEIYTAADMFLNLTYEDNYPTVNLEAQACGTPVVTYRTGGSPESAERFGAVVEQGALDRIVNIVWTFPSFERVRESDDSYERALKEYVNLY